VNAGDRDGVSPSRSGIAQPGPRLHGCTMGTEIVFVIIIPVALFCVSIAVWSWFCIASENQSSVLGRIAAYVPILAGFVVSLICLTFLTCFECYADFTTLIEEGYYTENQRAVFLTSRVIGQEIVNLLFVLPFICLLIVPLTARLIRKNKLNLKALFAYAMIGWVSLSLVGWLFNIAYIEPPYAMSYFFRSAGVPILAYGLPIPIAVILFRRRRPTA
jgi:hypothetical protein